MSYSTNICTNIQQNAQDFVLLTKQLAIFSKGLFTKTLNPPQENPRDYRTVTITYIICK
jgi:hypothetical protein